MQSEKACPPTSSNPSLNTTSIKLVHSLNAPVPIAVTVDGTWIRTSATQPANALSPTFSKPSFNETSLKLTHLINASSQISFTVDDNLIRSNFSQSRHTSSPIFCNPSLNSTSIKLEQCENRPIHLSWFESQLPLGVTRTDASKIILVASAGTSTFTPSCSCL